MKAFKQARNNSPLSATRKKFGLSQHELADQLGVDRSTISLVELNKRSLPTAALIKLAELEMTEPGQPLNQQPEPAPEQDDLAGPALDFWNRYCKKLLMREQVCKQHSNLLHIRLCSMISHYHKTNAWLNAIDAAAEARENAWVKRQRLVALRRLSKCGLPAQYLLRCRITLLEAESELNRNAYQQCQDDYSTLFLNQ